MKKPKSFLLAQGFKFNDINKYSSLDRVVFADSLLQHRAFDGYSLDEIHIQGLVRNRAELRSLIELLSVAMYSLPENRN